jgi:hypothetical protein
MSVALLAGGAWIAGMIAPDAAAIPVLIIVPRAA